MSCIAGIVNLDGAPVDRTLLERMTGAMESRAPDESNIWISGNVGFCHALLSISSESKNEHQPCTLDGKIWITADARIDGRHELINKLRSAGEQVETIAPDAKLILHAYATFGEKFLEQIIGDFAFALWDAREKKLICARDHFGVRPFFYFRTNKIFAFASDIDALLQHPAISRRLDEEAVADFLLFGSYQENTSSIYKDIRRLPAASFINIVQAVPVTGSYWALPLDQEIRYKRTSEYAEHFRELFEQSVNDRIRTNALALELSGGMDSTSIAAVAANSSKGAGRSITAYTTTCVSLLPEDKEGYYAGMAATYLNIPIIYQNSEDYGLFERFGDSRLITSEPVPHPDLAAHYENYVKIGEAGARVLLTGQGGDAVFNGSSTYYPGLLRSGRWLKFLFEAYQHVIHTGTWRGMGLRSGLLGSIGGEAWSPPLPGWFSKDFSRRVDLEGRWESGWKIINGLSDSYHQLQRPWLSQTFEAYEVLKMPLVARHPFFDVRLVIFLLGLPNFIKNSKRLMREAMCGKLPSAILSRPKTTLAGDQIRAKFINERAKAMADSRLLSSVAGYVEPVRYFEALNAYLGGKGEESTWSSAYMILPIALDVWLRDRLTPN